MENTVLPHHSPPDYTQYIENDYEALPATAIHRHAQAAYHTTKPGQKLVPGITIDFDLSDPFFVEYKPGEYSSLHDPHLKRFLNKKCVRNCLIKNKLITKDGWVKCTLQEFNRFQRNLKLYFQVQKRISTQIERKKIADPRKVLRNKYKENMLQKRIQHNVKIAEARARHTDSMMKRRKQIMDRIVQKDRLMNELISRVRLEREEMQGQAEIERKRRELLKIRLDSTELIRQHTILQRIKQKERMVNQKQLLKKQRRIKELYKKNLDWHKERISAKEDEMCKFLEDELCKQDYRSRSISGRTVHAEQNKNISTGRRKTVFNQHQRREDVNLEQARQWEKKVEDKRVIAANNWRAKMHCMQSVAEGRMADIERRKFERKRNAVARKKAQIEADLDMVEKMNVTVLGTTGYGSHELANIHRDNSKLRFSAYLDPGRDTIDPCRVTQFHSYFKPLYVINAKYQPGMAPAPPAKPATKSIYKKRHEIPKQRTPSLVSTLLSQSGLFDDATQTTLDDLMNEFMDRELSEIINECNEEIGPVIGVIDDLLDKVATETTGYKVAAGIVEDIVKLIDPIPSDVPSNEGLVLRMESIMSLDSDRPSEETSSTEWYTAATSSTTLCIDDLIEDVVQKIMACFQGQHENTYHGQTSTSDCCVEDGESIITKILIRLINTIQAFTLTESISARESAESMLSVTNSTSRNSIKDLHKRAQFLLNHALDVANVKLKMKGYSYLTWNILEDAMKKSKDKILAEHADRVGQFTDIELTDWIIDDAKDILRGATSVLYETLHYKNDEKKGKFSSEQVVEECYREQLKKIDSEDKNAGKTASEMRLEKYLQEGDVAKFAIALTQQTIGNAMTGIPRHTSIILAEALHDGDFQLAGSILSAKAITVAYNDIVLDPQTPSSVDLRKALRLGNVEKSGSLLAKKAIQQAMQISLDSGDSLENDVSSLVLKHALSVQHSVLKEDEDITVDDSLRSALQKLMIPMPDSVTLNDALESGDLDVAANLIIKDICTGDLPQMEKLMKDKEQEEKERSDTIPHSPASSAEELKEFKGDNRGIRRPSSMLLTKSLDEGNLDTAGAIIMSRALRSGITEVNGLDETPLPRRDSNIALTNALIAGELETAGDIMVSRYLRTGLKEVNGVFSDMTVSEKSPCPVTESDLLDQYLEVGDLESAAPILINRAITDGLVFLMKEEEKNNSSMNIINSNRPLISVSPFASKSALPKPESPSDVALNTALEKGDLNTAGDIIVDRALKSISPLVENIKSPSDLILENALGEGDLEAAGDIITNRALRSININKTPSDLTLDNALKTGDLDIAGNIIVDRALQSVSPPKAYLHSPINSQSNDELETALDSGDLETVADIIINRALKSLSPFVENEDDLENDENNEDPSEDEHTFNVIPVQSFEDLDVSEIVDSKNEDVLSSGANCMSDIDKLNDGIYLLEHLTSINKDTKGYTFLKHVVENVFDDLEGLFDDEAEQDYHILKESLKRSDYNEAAMVVCRLLFDKSRDFTLRELEKSSVVCQEHNHIVLKFILLVCRSILECGIEAFRGTFSNEISHAAGQLLNDYINDALTHHGNGGGNFGSVNSIVAVILSKAMNHIVDPETKELRTPSSFDLLRVSEDKGNLSGDIIVEKVLQYTEDLQLTTEGDTEIRGFFSGSDLLNEQAKKTIEKYSNTSLERKSKKKINQEGLPMPKSSSMKSSDSISTSYAPIRDMLISEEREARINEILSGSEEPFTRNDIEYTPSKRSIKRKSYSDIRAKESVERLSESCEKYGNLLKNNQREVGDTFVQLASDMSLPLLSEGQSNVSLSGIGYVRKIHSKGHVYYINSEGVIKKRTKKKRPSRKRLSQDDFVIRDDQSDSNCPRAISSESSIIQPNPPSMKAAETPISRSRSGFKKKDSNLQMLAVINSSYTNMIQGKKTVSSANSNSDSTNSLATKKPNIEDMLSETEKELIKKLSCHSSTSESGDEDNNHNDAVDINVKY